MVSISSFMYLKISRKGMKRLGGRSDQHPCLAKLPLERGLKVPTLKKVDSLATVLRVHPLTLLTLSYLDARTATEDDLRELLTRVFDEAVAVSESSQPSS